MSRARIAAVAAVPGVALAAGTAVAAPPGLTTIRVVSVSMQFVEHDTPPKGASKGDSVVYRDRLVNAVRQFGRKRGAVVGRDRGTMTYTSRDSARFDGVATLPGGTLRLTGPVRALANGGLVIPIDGGSGRYKHAAGTLTVGPGKDRALNTYEITLAALPVA